MKVKEMTDRVMVLFDEVTGSSPSGDAGDYRYRIYEAMDSIQTELASILSPVSAVKVIEAVGGCAKAGSDVLRIRYITTLNGEAVDFKNTGGFIELEDGQYRLFYDKYPDKTAGRADADEMELEISPEAQEAMVYGVCAYLLMNDEPELYNAYTGRYMSLITNLMAARDSRPFVKARGGVLI